MERIRIVVLSSKKYDVVKALQKLGAIDLRRSAAKLDDDSPPELYDKVSSLLLKYESAVSILDSMRKKQKHEAKARTAHMPLNDLLDKAEGFKKIDDIFALDEERGRLKDEISEMHSAKQMLENLSGIGINFKRMKSDTLAYKALLTSQNFAKKIVEILIEMKIHYEIIEKDVGKHELLFVALPKKELDTFMVSIKSADFVDLDISNRFVGDTPEESLKKLNSDMERHNARISDIERSFDSTIKNDYWKILSIKEMLAVEADRMNVNSEFKKTESTVVIEGWIPKKRRNDVESTLSSITKGHFVEHIETDELAPTLFKDSKIMKPFNSIVEFYSLPRSDEINPTPIFMLSFILFYGFMLSDVGYGIMSFLLAYFIAKKTDPEGLLHNTAKVWQIGAFSAMFFGVLSNQYFGLALNKYIFGSGFALFSWTKDTTMLIVITIIFGIVQVGLGLGIGFMNKMKHHEKKLAVSRLTSIVLLASGSIAIGGLLFNLFSFGVNMAASAVAVASLLATIALSGSEASEVTSLIAHPLSYSRIIGFGMASVIMAMLIDMGFAPQLSMGIPVFILFVILFLILHFMNMLLGIFEGAVQGARLNFVEFFSKFYTGSGTKFKPYGYKRIYTKED